MTFYSLRFSTFEQFQGVQVEIKLPSLLFFIEIDT